MKCDNCGVCCKYIILGIGNRKLNELEKQRGFVKVGDWALIPSTCADYNTETKRCKIYEKRPQQCADFEAGNMFCLLCREAEGIKGLSEKSQP